MSRSLTLPEVADSLSQKIDEFKVDVLDSLQANVVDVALNINNSEARMNAAREFDRVSLACCDERIR